eukprot:gene12045-5441_t
MLKNSLLEKNKKRKREEESDSDLFFYWTEIYAQEKEEKILNKVETILEKLFEENDQSHNEYLGIKLFNKIIEEKDPEITKVVALFFRKIFKTSDDGGKKLKVLISPLVNGFLMKYTYKTVPLQPLDNLLKLFCTIDFGKDGIEIFEQFFPYILENVSKLDEEIMYDVLIGGIQLEDGYKKLLKNFDKKKLFPLEHSFYFIEFMCIISEFLNLEEAKMIIDSYIFTYLKVSDLQEIELIFDSFFKILEVHQDEILHYFVGYLPKMIENIKELHQSEKKDYELSLDIYWKFIEELFKSSNEAIDGITKILNVDLITHKNDGSINHILSGILHFGFSHDDVKIMFEMKLIDNLKDFLEKNTPDFISEEVMMFMRCFYDYMSKDKKIEHLTFFYENFSKLMEDNDELISIAAIKSVSALICSVKSENLELDFDFNDSINIIHNLIGMDELSSQKQIVMFNITEEITEIYEYVLDNQRQLGSRLFYTFLSDLVFSLRNDAICWLSTIYELCIFDLKRVVTFQFGVPSVLKMILTIIRVFEEKTDEYLKDDLFSILFTLMEPTTDDEMTDSRQCSIQIAIQLALLRSKSLKKYLAKKSTFYCSWFLTGPLKYGFDSEIPLSGTKEIIEDLNKLSDTIIPLLSLSAVIKVNFNEIENKFQSFGKAFYATIRNVKLTEFEKHFVVDAFSDIVLNNLEFSKGLFSKQYFSNVNRESHLTKMKQKQRANYFFEITMKSKLFDDPSISVALVYLSKILKRLNDKISDKKFICLLLSCLYHAYNGGLDEYISIKDLYNEFHVFVHYITFKEAENWVTHSLLALDCDLSVSEEDLLLLQKNVT